MMVVSPINTNIYIYIWLGKEKNIRGIQRNHNFPCRVIYAYDGAAREGAHLPQRYYNIDYTSGALSLYSNYSIKIHLGSGVSLYFWVRFFLYGALTKELISLNLANTLLFS
jgi:hypothetical protein